MFATSGAFYFINSTWKLVDQDFDPQYPMNLVWDFECAIVVQIQSSSPQ